MCCVCLCANEKWSHATIRNSTHVCSVRCAQEKHQVYVNLWPIYEKYNVVFVLYRFRYRCVWSTTHWCCRCCCRCCEAHICLRYCDEKIHWWQWLVCACAFVCVWHSLEIVYTQAEAEAEEQALSVWCDSMWIFIGVPIARANVGVPLPVSVAVCIHSMHSRQER